MNQLSEVVKNLLIINVIIYFAINLSFLNQYAHFFEFYPIGSTGFRPVQILTHMFNHGNLTHLFFNMMALYFFGPNVERVWGPKKFLFFYLLCGLGSILLHVVLGGGGRVVGASGAISGVLLAFAYLYPNAKVMLLIPPIPMKAKFLVVGLLVIDLYLGITGARTGIAHFAHIGGALMGVGLIFFF